MRISCASFLAAVMFLCPSASIGASPVPKSVDVIVERFERFEAGTAPQGFTSALTGEGGPGRWIVREETSAPSGTKVLAQLSADGTDYRFPHCVYDGFKAVDAEVAVRFKPVSGDVDRAAGIVWRYADAANYYIVRANALEGNVVLYKVEKGRRTDLKPKGSSRGAYGKDAKVPSGEWSELQVIAKGDLFEIRLNGKKLFEVEDATFRGAGKVGLWTKADSVTYFDDLRMARLDRP